MLIDTHAHLEIFPRNSTKPDDLSHVLTRAIKGGVSKIITIGTTIDSCSEAIEIAENKSINKLGIWASCGIHPTDSKDEFVLEDQLDLKMNTLRKIVESSKKVVAIGECGLDYYMEGQTTNKKLITTEDEKEFQRKLFVSQIKIAKEFNLPIIVHCRNGWSEIFELISDYGPINGVFHSFTGGTNELNKALNLGFYISFSGIVTFKNAGIIKEAAELAPLDKVLIETDSPFLSPHPLRGQNNEPRNVRITASYLANLKNIPENNFFEKTSENAEKLFNLC